MPRHTLTALVALILLSTPLAYAEPPPIASATCRARLEGSALVVDVAMTLARPARQDVAVRLLPSAFPLVGRVPRGQAARVTLKQGAYWLTVSPGAAAPGELTLSFRAPVYHGRDWLARLRRFAPALARDPALRAAKWAPMVAKDPTLRVCVLPLVPAVATTVDLPAPCHDLETQPPAPVERTAKGWRLYPPARPRLFLVWRTTPPAAAVAPVFRVDADASVTVARRSLTAETELTVNMLQGELRELTVALPRGAQLRSVAGKGLARWELRAGKVSATFAAPVAKRAALTLRTEVLAADVGEFDWRPVEVAGAQHQGGRAYFRAVAGLLLRAVGRKGFERVSDGYAPDAAAGRQTLVLAYPRLPASIRLAVEELRPRLTASVAMLARLERGVVTQRARIDYTIHDVGVRRYRVRVGEGADVLEAACPGLLDYELADGVLTVRLRDAVKGKGQLALVVPRPMQRHAGVDSPRLTALDVERQSGLMGVAAGAKVELRHRRAVEADQIDVRLLPEWVRQLGPKLAYRFYDRPNSLVAVETAPLRPEFDVFANETCRLSEAGWSREVAWRCRVLRGEVFAWRLHVPEGLVPLAVDATVPAQASKGPRRAVRQTTVLKDWEFDEASRVLKVTLSRGVTAEARLMARLEQRVADPTAPITLRGLTLEGVRRHAGQLMLRAAIPVALRAGETSGLATTRGEGSEWVFAEEAADWTLPLEPAVIKPVLSVQTVAVLGVRPGQVAVEALLTFSITKAPVNELRVRLPEGAVNSVVRGPDVKSSQLDGRDWTLRLARKVAGSYALTLTYDHVIPAEGGACTCPTVEVPGAARHEGFVLVARDSERIEVAVEQPQGLFETDPADVPRRGPTLARRAVIDAYRYTGGGSLVARIDVLSRADVVEAKALGANVFTMVKPDGETVTQLIYDLQSTNRQFLRVELPPDATLLAAYVDSAPVPSAVDPEGGTLIPLLGGARATDGVRQDAVLEVSLFYAQRTAPLGSGRRLTLLSPPVDVPTQTMSWAVYLPPGYRAQRAKGNMKLMSQPRSHRWWVLVGRMFRDEVPLAHRLVGWLGAAVGVAWLVVRAYGGYLLVAMVAALAGSLVYRRRGAIAARWRAYAEARAKRLARRAARTRRPALAWSVPPLLGCLAAILFVLVVAALLVPTLGRASRAAKSTQARANLRQIGKCVFLYAQDSAGKDGGRPLPRNAEDIRRYLDGDESALRDPATDRTFVYLRPHDRLDDIQDPARTPLGYLEGSSRVNMLFADGRVQGFRYGDPALEKFLPGRHLRQPSRRGGHGWRLGGAEEESLTTTDESVAPGPGTTRSPSTGTARRGRALGDLKEGDRPAGRFAEVQDRPMGQAEREVLETEEQFEQLEKKGKLDYAQRQMLGRLRSRRVQQDEYYRGVKPGGKTEYAEMDPHATKGTRNGKPPTKPKPTPKPGPAPAEPAQPAAEPPGVLGPDTAPKRPEQPPDDLRPGQDHRDTGGGKVGGEGSVEQPSLYVTSAFRYSAVRGGRQKGALPIAIELPDERALPYIFYRPVTVRAQGEVTLDCRRMGSSRPAKGILLVGAIAFVALVGTGLKRRRARGRSQG